MPHPPMDNTTSYLLDRAVRGDIETMTPAELAAVHVALERLVGEHAEVGVTTVGSEMASDVRASGWTILKLLGAGGLVAYMLIPSRYVVAIAAGLGLLRGVFKLLDHRIYGADYRQARERVAQRIAEVKLLNADASSAPPPAKAE